MECPYINTVGRWRDEKIEVKRITGDAVIKDILMRARSGRNRMETECCGARGGGGFNFLDKGMGLCYLMERCVIFHEVI